MKFLIIFIILSFINVTFSTIRSILTIKGGKVIASLTSGGYFAFYNIMLIYTVADFPMWEKCIITFVCNVVSVYLVKHFEEKMRKDKLWKIETSVPVEKQEDMIKLLDTKDISYNYVKGVGDYTVFNIFSKTQEDSHNAREIIERFDVKYFVTESKIL